MKRLTAVAVLSAFLAACGGGDDNASSQANSGPAIKLTYSGAPLVSSSSKARMMAAADTAASAPVASDSQDTITRLQDAFKARGADIGVYPGIVNGSKLHDIVMSVDNGVGPTNAELAAANASISTWTLVNFQFDDMRGYIDTPEKKAMVEQFRRDIQVYRDREYLKGNVVFVPLALGSCLANRADAQTAMQEFNNIARDVGAFNAEAMAAPPTLDPAHMGADCETPDSDVQQAYFNHVVDFLTWHYTTALDTINKCKHNPEAIPENERAGQCWGIEPDKK
ncbi:hypothetical protein [Burkholderia cenocepacia]|uniref:hypothetical protein n=1 Tax=Burkholderia cenocepacia TaxID=95486 RepID=UPI00351C5283